MFVHRHIGPRPDDVAQMLRTLGQPSLEALMRATIPDSIRLEGGLDIGPPRGEAEMLGRLRATIGRNSARRSLLGQGYHGCLVPTVVQRNILENPGWYTAYTPYQAEISQGRLEALLNFQTMLSELSGLPLCNASLLDEGTAAAEAMALAHRVLRGKRDKFVAQADLHPQTLAVLATRAAGLGMQLQVVADPVPAIDAQTCGVLVQYPDTYGRIIDPSAVIEAAHAAGALAVVAADPLAMVLLRPPGELGADVVVGSAQRFGVPMGFGGPHAAFLATADAHKRHVPGRMIGVSKDSYGRVALRMAMQTREQHIRREKATSNICTAQVLLAVMASMYGVYHGPKGLQAIARRVHLATEALAVGLTALGHAVDAAPRFDTLRIQPQGGAAAAVAAAAEAGFDVRAIDDATVGVSLDETITRDDLVAIARAFGAKGDVDVDAWLAAVEGTGDLVAPHARESEPLRHPIFSQYHAEHELLRYIHRLQSKDLSLTTSMIPLGSCTMKLNGTSEMVPVTWPDMATVHPFAPADTTVGYREMIDELSRWLRNITGFAAVSLQPNAGSQGEYAGLLTIAAYHRDRGEGHRNVCLIPVSAHGTNPASAVMAGMKVVVVACDAHGNIDVEDLRAKAVSHADTLAALMVTYPSTHGVFEAKIREICEVVHEHGGQVYLDGANMNAQVGLCRPGDYGADVCHLNLHKTFCIPHGGGGPGVGPIGVASHLAPFLPGHPVVRTGGERAIGPVAAAPFGSAGILAISYMYIGLMGSEGLADASRVAILNANYMAARLREHYDVLFTGERGTVAHEFILDLRPLEAVAGVEAQDVAKRLIDYGFHAPTMSFPVAGTLMIEPTESESKEELDRLCDALIAIRAEIARVEDGQWPRDDNPLVNAPHTAAEVTAETWTHPYSRAEAAYPAPWSHAHKYWPPVSRIDNAYGDRNLICLCPPIETYQ
jgi:glycine dehydrogenase